MSHDHIERALALIAEREDGDFEGPKDPALVESAEAELGLVFPSSYREFLGRLGCGDICGLEVYGIIGERFDTSSLPDAIWITKKERLDASLPLHLVLVAGDGMGSYFALDTSRMGEDNECPVVLWEPGMGVREQVANDFGSFLLESVRAAIA